MLLRQSNLKDIQVQSVKLIFGMGKPNHQYQHAQCDAVARDLELVIVHTMVLSTDHDSLHDSSFSDVIEKSIDPQC